MLRLNVKSSFQQDDYSLNLHADNQQDAIKPNALSQTRSSKLHDALNKIKPRIFMSIITSSECCELQRVYYARPTQNICHRRYQAVACLPWLVTLQLWRPRRGIEH